MHVERSDPYLDFDSGNLSNKLLLNLPWIVDVLSVIDTAK
jgi:hypothetical protein